MVCTSHGYYPSLITCAPCSLSSPLRVTTGTRLWNALPVSANILEKNLRVALLVALSPLAPRARRFTQPGGGSTLRGRSGLEIGPEREKTSTATGGAARGAAHPSSLANASQNELQLCSCGRGRRATLQDEVR